MGARLVVLVGLSVAAAASSRRSIVLPVAAARGVRYVTSCGTQSSVDTAMGHTVALLHRSNTQQNRLQRNLKHCRIYLPDTIARSSAGVMRGGRRYIHTLGTLSCAQREPSTSINYKTGMIMNFKCIVLHVGTSGWQPANTHTGPQLNYSAWVFRGWSSIIVLHCLFISFGVRTCVRSYMCSSRTRFVIDVLFYRTDLEPAEVNGFGMHSR